MSLLALEKVQQLRSQLEQCTDRQTAATYRVAIARLLAKLEPCITEPVRPQTSEAILQSLIEEGKVKVYQPAQAAQQEPAPVLANSDIAIEREQHQQSGAMLPLHIEFAMVHQPSPDRLQGLIDQGSIKVYPL